MSKYLEHIQFKNEALDIRDADAQQKIQDLQNNANLQAEAIARHSERISANESDISSLEQRMNTAETDIDALEGRASACESDIADIKADITEINGDIDSINEDILDIKTDIVGINDDITEMQSDIGGLSSAMIDAQANIQTLDEAVGDLDSRLDTAEGNIGNLDDEVAGLQASDVRQDSAIAELERKVTASTYEAGNGIYFGQGDDHTNINVEDELLDEIHESTRKNEEQDGRLDGIDDVIESLGALAFKDSASGSYTPSGTVSQPTFSGDSMNSTGSFTPAGTVSQPTFSGDSMNSTGSFTPAGTVSLTDTNKKATVSKVSGQATYTPEGTCSGADVSLNTTTVNSIEDVGTLPSATMPDFTYTANDELLTITAGAFSAGTLPTKGADTTVATGVNSITQPTFTGTGARLETANIAVPTSASFSGTQGSVSVSGTPAGTVSQPTFSGTQDTVTVTGTPAGTVSQPTFSGDAATITVS